nr:50S ribosomal protein L18P [uncultured archaeon]
MRTIRKRRLEAKTDYKARLELLKSGKPRLVIRKTSRYIIAQIVLSENAQDKVLKGFTSLSLVKKGLPKDKIGNIQKSRIYALVKGVIDGGLKIPASTNSIPSIEEIKNDKISFDKIKSSI